MSNTSYHPTEEHKERVRKGIKNYWKNNPHKRKIIKCVFCDDFFKSSFSKRKGRSKFCSKICYSKYLKVKMLGRGNHFYKKHHSIESRKEIGENFRKSYNPERHPRWKGGITPINERIRKSIEYKLWREAVFARDNYTCIWCGDNKGHNLNADHIKPFSLYPELRFAIDNGRTLCLECHKKTETFGCKLGKFTV